MRCSKQRVTEKSKKSQAAESEFIPLVRRNGHTFALVMTKTGRKHQIRVHAQWMGYPLVGEKLYGKDESYYLKFCEGGWKEEWRSELGMSRQALHGRFLGFTDRSEYFEAELADDMRKYLNDHAGIEEIECNELVRHAGVLISRKLNDE